MDWLNFFELITNSYIQLIHYTAWPLTVLVLILIFRKAILSWLGSLRKLHIGNKLTLEFFRELQQKTTEKIKFSEVTKDSYSWENYLDALEQWLGWVTFCIAEIIVIRTQGFSTEVELKMLKPAMHEFNIVSEKIKKERPESETLKIMYELIDRGKSELKSYESSKPKPHWSDYL